MSNRVNNNPLSPSSLLLFLIVVMLTACTVPSSVIERMRESSSEVNGTPFSRLDERSDVATVYFYRTLSAPLKLNPQLKVNGTVVAELAGDTYTVIQLKPGTYTIMADWGALYALSLNVSDTLTVSAGKSYYAKIYSEVVTYISYADVHTHMQLNELTQVPEDLAACKYVEPHMQ